ncbi:MAG: hypothetical protein FJ210_03605 [Betaproteobacteria bacterium]|nr:hypothetical protein [Betaproteobacteria bacterium]
MTAIKDIAKYIRKNPDTEEARIMQSLCESLEQGRAFDLGSIYNMKDKAYNLSIAFIDEWRFDRHVKSRRLGKYLAEKPEDNAAS